ncbi:MAG: S41 family peptidase [Phycisphaerales bacterium]
MGKSHLLAASLFLSATVSAGGAPIHEPPARGGTGTWEIVDPPVSAGQAPANMGVTAAPSGTPVGYYRHPTIYRDTIVFVAEGDLWRVGTAGGKATRLTSHLNEELWPAFSPDGAWIAFTGHYEGPPEVYVMPLAGGLPKRLTFDGVRCWVCGWTPDGKIIAATERFSTLPNFQLTLINPSSGARELVELWQAADGAYGVAPSGGAAPLFFTRLQFQGSSTKRYKGGTAQNLWRWDGPGSEAIALTPDYAGTSKRAMFRRTPDGGRVYFLTDRDGHMNIWSMRPDGKDLQQHTRHKGFDAQGGSIDDAGPGGGGGGKIVYQLGADLWTLDLATGANAAVPISLDTDLDQMRERWVEKPMEYLTSAAISPDGDRVVMVARGQVFVAPHRQGRIVNVCRDDSIRYRGARFTPDGASLIALSDKSGEIELWKLPANGLGEPEQLTSDGTVLRWDAVPSPDGKLIAHHDKNQALWIYDVSARTSTRIDTTSDDSFEGLTWSGDSRWLAYTARADNTFQVVRLYGVDDHRVTQVTTDRYTSYSPAWSADGKWLYFLSDRNLRSLQPSPWGANQPDPYFDESTKVYALGLKPGERWPFQPSDELAPKEKDRKDSDKEKEKEAGKPAVADGMQPAGEPKADAQPEGDEKGEKSEKGKKADAPARVEIVLEGLSERLYEVPIPSGNYERLQAGKKALFLLSAPMAYERKNSLAAVEIRNEHVELKTLLADVSSYEMSQDRAKLLVRQRDSLSIIDASASPPSDMPRKQVSLSGWTLSVVPRVQWRQMFIDSWRLMRDYFYDPAMHGVNWRAMLDKYLPLVERVTTRAELNDLIAQMVGELSALHHFVRGGDQREGPDEIGVAALGGVLERDDAAGGWRITRIYQCEADDPGRVSPLARPEVGAKVGDVIESIDGTPTLSVPDYSMLLRAKAGQQVLLRLKPAQPAGAAPEAPAFGEARSVIVVPITQGSENDLRYTDWEYSRRLDVERMGEGKIGYVHLRAMGRGDITSWVKGYYPVFNRDGLIIDVRHNRGGNIDSWILGKLLRKAWFYWSPRVGNPAVWNMQYAFRGHMVVLCNERTASDGEAFSEGFRRLGLGKVIGTRTWGGEIWLSSSNVLVDRGIASAAETGVWGPEGVWLIEGHGVDPDIVVDNLPHATFQGKDAQLEAAITYLQQRMREQPVLPAVPPAKPDKSFENK